VMLTSDHDEDGNKITTSNPDAEAFSSEDLVFDDGANEEDLSAYGVLPDSRYVKMSGRTGSGKVCVSSALVGKYGLTAGDTVKLKDKYGYGVYEPEISGVVDYDGGIAVFMDNDSFNEMFDRDEGSYDGFFSDSEITDIDDDFVAAVITQDDILKMAAQLDHSMGAYMLYFQYLCVLLSAVLLFLLTKVIVERNEKSISMIKILGYTNGEVVKLYLVTTTIVVIISELITVFASKSAMAVIWKNMLARMSGYFPFVLRPAGMLRMCILVFAGYLIVMLVDFRRIRRIPMDEALKDME